MPAAPRRPPARDPRTIFWRVISEYGPRLPLTALGVYTALCRRADAHGQCWPSYDELSAELGLSHPTLGKALGVLQDLELVHIRRRSRQSGHRSLYTLLDPFEEPTNEQ